MVETVDVLVIGAGVVGLAVARALSRQGREVIIAEKNKTFGEETSSRNSEVIHAGIQYDTHGVRASLAVKGRDGLYDFCQSHGVSYQRCGKLLVARDKGEIEKLKALKYNAERNGVGDLTILSADDARALEPELYCAAAILSPSSGVIDAHGLMLALLGDTEEAGGVLAVSSPVTGGQVSEQYIEIDIGGAGAITLRARTVVNCAGLHAETTARSIHGIPSNAIPAIKFGKGQYFTYAGPAPFTRLIYPLPSPDSQGIHYTRDLGGQAKLGPDINFVDRNDDYDVDESRRSVFAEAARRFWPSIQSERLIPGYAGIRPKIKGPGEEGDFIFSGASTHGVRGYLGLYGIESPGLTTCLAIADHAAVLLKGE